MFDYCLNMAFDAHVLKILIASPGDTIEERDAVEGSLHGWNASRAEREQVILLPQRWETHAVPRLGGSGQSIINEQLVDAADVIIALFDTRLGQATDDAVSGTADEIQRAHKAGKPVHVYFSGEPLPRDVNAEQLTALRDFKASLQSQGLLGTYANPEDLAYQVRSAVEHDLSLLNLGTVPRRRGAEEHAILRVEYKFDREPRTDNKGRIKSHTTNQRLEVTNHGAVTAERVRIRLEAVGEGSPPHMHDSDVTPDIIPQSHFDFPVLMLFGAGTAFKVILTWHEGDAEQAVTQTVAG